MSHFSPPNIGIIVQARNGSTRLPAKMTRVFYDENTILDIILHRLKANAAQLPIVLATTTSHADDALVAAAQSAGVAVYRGSQDDVLGRFIEASTAFELEGIIRVCADNPFLSLNFLDALATAAMQVDCDYASFCNSAGVPTILTHYGFFCEYVTREAMERAYRFTSDSFYREHVTNFIYKHPELFSLNFRTIPPILEEYPLRLTVDTQSDFEVAKNIYSQLMEKKMTPEWENVLSIALENPILLETMTDEISRNKK
jgi:spore coat polysaccharide biosynthesis protein SpsF